MRRLCSTVFFSVTVVRRLVRLVVTVWPSVFVLLVSVTVVWVLPLEVGAVPGPSSRAAAGGASGSGAALADGTATGSGGKLDKSAAVALDSVKGAAEVSALCDRHKSAAPTSVAIRRANAESAPRR